MKQYEKAINELPQKGDLKFVKEEVDFSLNAQTDEDKIQAPMHILKAAKLCLEEWCQLEEFAPTVFENVKKIEYSDMDLFQKGILHILSYCPYKDGFFDIENASVNYEWDANKWNKTLKVFEM